MPNKTEEPLDVERALFKLFYYVMKATTKDAEGVEDEHIVESWPMHNAIMLALSHYMMTGLSSDTFNRTVFSVFEQTIGLLVSLDSGELTSKKASTILKGVGYLEGVVANYRSLGLHTKDYDGALGRVRKNLEERIDE